MGSSGLERNTLLVVQLPALSEHVLSNRVSGLVVSAKMIQFARLDWKGDITVVIDPAFLSRSVIAEQFRGVEPWLSSSWTAMENTFQVMRHAFLPPNKIPNGLVDVFSPYTIHTRRRSCIATGISVQLGTLISDPSSKLAPLCRLNHC